MKRRYLLIQALSALRLLFSNNSIARCYVELL